VTRIADLSAAASLKNEQARLLAVFELIRRARHGDKAVVCVFDLIELDGQDLRHHRKNTAIAQRKEAQDQLDQRNSEYSVLSDRYKSLVTQLNAQPNLNCMAIPTAGPNGSAGPPKQSCRENPALKPLRTEIDATKAKLNESEALVKQAQASVTKLDPHSVDNELSNAQKEYRDAVFQSPLHSYTAMLFNKDPKEVSEGEVKTLEWYLILIPSIAAALSSTLIAMTAVHRIKRAKTSAPTTVPDDAVTFLFGPLLAEIRKTAEDAVNRAVDDRDKKKPHLGERTKTNA
jgi:hypothetical protein